MNAIGGKVNQTMKRLLTSTRGATYVEQVVLISTVAIGFAAGVILLGHRLLDYHTTIEFILALPIP